jgi:hypothetical protein
VRFRRPELLFKPFFNGFEFDLIDPDFVGLDYEVPHLM